MAVIDIPRFVASPTQVALRVSYDRLPGLFSKRLDVPPEAVALLRRSDKTTRLVAGGAGESDFVDGILVKKAPLNLTFALTGLTSEDNLDVSVEVRLDVQPRATEVDLGQLEKELLGAREALHRGEVEGYFLPFVREAVRFFCTKKKAQALVAEDQRVALDAHLKQELQKPCFEGGLDVLQVLHPAFKSAGFEQLQQKDVEAKLKAEALEKEKQLQDLKATLDKESLLKDLAARDEVDAK